MILFVGNKIDSLTWKGPWEVNQASSDIKEELCQLTKKFVSIRCDEMEILGW